MIKASRPELYPLTVHDLDRREFVRRWNSMRAMFADRSVRDGIPGSPDLMDFPGAVMALKGSHHVARTGWYGGLYVTLQDGYPDGIELNENTAQATGLPQGTLAVFQPYLIQCTPPHRPWDATGRVGPIVPASFSPWAPTSDDVLAEDWQIVPRPGQQEQTDDVVVDIAQLGEPRRSRS